MSPAVATASGTVLKARLSHLSLVSPGTPSDNRRAHIRHRAADLDWLAQVRLKYGPVVSLIDLSIGGAQIETDRRLLPGSTVVIEIAGADGDLVVPSQVLRCLISGVSPHAMYRGALAFRRLLQLPQAATSVIEEEPDSHRSLLQEHARASLALRHLASISGVLLAERGQAAIAAGEASLAGALMAIESPSGKRSGPPFRRQMIQLFQAVTHALETDADPDQIVHEIGDRLRRTIPARTVRIVDAGQPSSVGNSEAIFFDVPSHTRPGSRLLVELTPDGKLEEWHFQFLKTAAHLIALTNEVASIRRIGMTAGAEEPPQETADGWHRCVVHYADGRVLKGYGRNFRPGQEVLELWPTPEPLPHSKVTVQLRHLKAIFFVHELDGIAPGSRPPAAIVGDPGRDVCVTFRDGEILEGRTLNYSEGRPGFFVVPRDEGGNNIRIFVASAAIRSVHET